MQKLLIIWAVVLICLPALLLAKGDPQRRPNNRKNQRESTPAALPKDCGQWTEGPCVAKNNVTNCGAGNKIKTRTGDNCPVREKTFKCKIPCATDGAEGASSAGGRGRARPGKAACKYTKGQWSECDANTNTRTRTLTLKTSNRRNAPAATDCEPTKTMTKRCPPTGVKRQSRRGGRNE